MDSSFFVYMDRLVLMGFFSGYPLIYLIILLLGENSYVKRRFKINISSLLPYAYALLGILYLGLLLKNLYPYYSFEHIKTAFADPELKIWGLLSILFLIPVLSRKKVYSLVHSLVFFFFLVKDLFLNFFNSAGKEIVRNDMNIYTSSLVLNLAAFVIIFVIYLLLIEKRRKNIPQ